MLCGATTTHNILAKVLIANRHKNQNHRISTVKSCFTPKTTRKMKLSIVSFALLAASVNGQNCPTGSGGGVCSKFSCVEPSFLHFHPLLHLALTLIMITSLRQQPCRLRQQLCLQMCQLLRSQLCRIHQVAMSAQKHQRMSCSWHRQFQRSRLHGR